MHHAENSHFAAGVTKQEAYSQLLQSLVLLTESQRNWVAATANCASLLWHMFHSLPSPSSSVNWAGFYVLDPTNSSQLILGPFQGKVACQTIQIGRGVCGTSAKEGRSIMLDDVESFLGHIACDGESRSEIVVPIVREDKVVGVIDVDCAEYGGFDQVDSENLEALARVLGESCDW